MSIPEIDPATFAVPANQLLVYKSGDLFYGKKSNEEIVEVDTDDMIRMDLTAADLPCLLPESVYTKAHAEEAMMNLDKSSAFTKTAAYKYGKMIKDQKASKAELTTAIYEIEELIKSTGGDVSTERARAMAAESGLQDNITTLDNSITFKKLIDRIWIYGSDVYDLNYMVGTGIYYCSTDASVVGTAMTNMPEGTAEGILIVTKNSQVFIEGGTAKGRMYYRYETGAGAEVTQYTEAWVAGAMLSDVTSLDAEIKAIIGDLPAGKTVAEAIAGAAADGAGLRTAVEATAGSGAIAVTAGADAATKNIALTLDGSSLSQSANGLKADLVIAKQENAETGFAATYFLTDATGTNVYGSKINLIKDQFLKAAVIFNATEDEAPADWSGDAYVKGHKYIKFTWEITKGSPDSDDDTIVYLDVESLVDAYTSGSTAVVVDNDHNTIALAIDNTTVETAEGVNTTVLVQTANGLKAQGIQDAIDYAVSVEASRATLAEEAIAADLETEVGARETAVSGEASAREAADSALNTALRAEIAKKVDHRIANGDGSEALIFNESDGGGAKFTTSTGFISFVGVNDGTDGLYGQIYALSKNAQDKYEGVRLNVQADKITYKNNGLYADSFDAKYELAVKNDLALATADLTVAIATAKSEAIDAAEAKDVARYATVTEDISAVRADLAETNLAVAANATAIAGETAERKEEILNYTRDYTAFEVYPTSAVIPAGATDAVTGLEYKYDVAAEMTATFIIHTTCPTAESDIIVDWGDGNRTFIKDVPPEDTKIDGNELEVTVRHTYAESDRFIVKFFGTKYFGFQKLPSGVISIVSRAFASDLPIAKHISCTCWMVCNSDRIQRIDVPTYMLTQGKWNMACTIRNNPNLLSVTGVRYFQGDIRSVNSFFHSNKSLEMTDFVIPAYSRDGSLDSIFSGNSSLEVDIATLFPKHGFIGKAYTIDWIFNGCAKLYGTVPADKLWGDPNIKWSNTSHAFGGCSADIRAQVPVSWGGTNSAIDEAIANGTYKYSTQKQLNDAIAAEAARSAEDLATHAASNARHTAPIEFVRTAATISELEFKRYICKATLDGTLPAAPADGTEMIVKVVAGGESTVIRAADGDKIDDGSVSGASVVALNYSNQTYDFIYDADAKLWYIL